MAACDGNCGNKWEPKETQELLQLITVRRHFALVHCVFVCAAVVAAAGVALLLPLPPLSLPCALLGSPFVSQTPAAHTSCITRFLSHMLLPVQEPAVRARVLNLRKGATEAEMWEALASHFDCR